MPASHPIHRITSFSIVGPHSLELHFADGVCRTIDLGPVLAGRLFGPLRDPEFFRQVRLDPEVHTVVWPNGADFDPATLHDWSEFVEEFADRAKRWGSQAA